MLRYTLPVTMASDAKAATEMASRRRHPIRNGQMLISNGVKVATTINNIRAVSMPLSARGCPFGVIPKSMNDENPSANCATITAIKASPSHTLHFSRTDT